MCKILVLDLDKSIRMLYADELTDEGHEVITIGDGSRLMALISKMGPDLVVMDIRLGHYNGLELLRDIRRSFYDLPVILCSSYPVFQGDMELDGASYYMVKSSNLNALKSMIKIALEGSTHPSSGVTYDKGGHPGEPIPVKQVRFPW
ncbi:MAG: response regulator [Pseudomonadota bacterium]